MGVFKVNKTKNYTIMSNTHLQEKEMSLKAKGLLSLMLSLPENWDYSILGLCSLCVENETAIKTALKELKNFGYLVVTKKMPNETASGRIEYEYNIFEQPQIQGVEKQGIEKQGVENLPLEIPPQENTKRENTNNKYNIYIGENEVFVADDSSAVHKDEQKGTPLTERKQGGGQKVDKIPPTKLRSNGSETSAPKHALQDAVTKVVTHLNAVLGTKYRTNTPLTVRLIKTRLSEGFTLDDFITVIDKKAKAWSNTEYARFLRPETLFGTKFESYLNEASATHTNAPFTPQHFDNERAVTDDTVLLKNIDDIDF